MLYLISQLICTGFFRGGYFSLVFHEDTGCMCNLLDNDAGTTKLSPLEHLGFAQQIIHKHGGSQSGVSQANASQALGAPCLLAGLG